MVKKTTAGLGGFLEIFLMGKRGFYEFESTKMEDLFCFFKVYPPGN